MSYCIAAGSEPTADGKKPLEIRRIVEMLEFDPEPQQVRFDAGIYVHNRSNESAALHLLHRGNAALSNDSQRAYQSKNSQTELFKKLYSSSLGKYSLIEGESVHIAPIRFPEEHYRIGNAGLEPFEAHEFGGSANGQNDPFVPFSYFTTVPIAAQASEIIRVTGALVGSSLETIQTCSDEFTIIGGNLLLDRIAREDIESDSRAARFGYDVARYGRKLDYFRRFVFTNPRYYHLLVNRVYGEEDLQVEPLTPDLSIGRRAVEFEEQLFDWYWSDSSYFETRVGGLQLAILGMK